MPGKYKSLPLPHFNDRPHGAVIDTFIIHSINAGENCSAANCVDLLDKHSVAAHYLIDRAGATYQLVEEKHRAWHAGESKLPFANDQRAVINDFSIGVELITTSDNSFTEPQYSSLAKLTKEIAKQHPLRYVLGHEHISPGRKADPGANFDWDKYRKLCGDLKFQIGI
jgi:AmpD protein